MWDTFIFSRVINVILCSFWMYFYGSALFAQTLIIGTLPFNPPFETVTKKNMFLGLDIEIMQAVCASLKASCQFKALRFPEIFEQIDSGEIDLGIAAIIIDKLRMQKYSLSIPYLPSNAQFIVNHNSTLKDPSQLVGKKLAPFLLQFLLHI